MTCQEVEKDLIPYAEGDLNDVRSEGVRAHVATCMSCRAEVQAVRRTLETAAAYRVPALSEASAVRMLARIRAQVERRRRWRAYRLIPVFGAAAATLILTVVGLRDRRPIAAPYAAQEVDHTSAGADRIALVSEDPELFDAVIERLSTLDVSDTPVRGTREGNSQTSADSGTGSPFQKVDPIPLWREYQRQYLRGVKIESLLRDLNDEEVDQVLQKIEERLTV